MVGYLLHRFSTFINAGITNAHRQWDTLKPKAVLTYEYQANTYSVTLYCPHKIWTSLPRLTVKMNLLYYISHEYIEKRTYMIFSLL